MSRLRVLPGLLLVAGLAGCGDDDMPVEPPAPVAEVTNVVLSANEFNNLSIVVDSL